MHQIPSTKRLQYVEVNTPSYPSLAAADKSSSSPSFSLYISQSMDDLATVDTALGPLIVSST